MSTAACMQADPVSPRPVVRVVRETVLVLQEGAESGDLRYVEVEALGLALRFESHNVLSKDLAHERATRMALEQFGAVEIDGMEITSLPGARIDFVIDIEGDADVVGNFHAYAIPKLEAMGIAFEREVDAVVLPESVVANLEPVGESVSWFDVELGVEVGGETVDLLGPVLDLLERNGLEDIERCGRPFSGLQLPDGRVVALPRERVRAILEVLSSFYDPDGSPSRLRMSEYDAWGLEALEDAFGETAVQWSGGFATRPKRRPSNVAARNVVEPPRRLQATLRPYQKTGLAWMQALIERGAGGVMADDMGLGKTLQTIAHLCKEFEKGNTDRPSLVVAPTSLVTNWRRELQRFAPHLSVAVVHGAERKMAKRAVDNVEIVLTTYPILLREEEFFDSKSFHLVVLDEAQAIKNRRSRAHAAVCRLDARARLCLSGTPIENNLGELYSLFEFLMPGFLGDPESFRSRYRWPIEREANLDRLLALRRRLGPYVLRRTKAEVLDELPEKTEEVLEVELDVAQRDLYETVRIAAHASVRTVLAERGLGGSTVDILSALTKLRQICCDPRISRGVPGAEEAGSAKYEAFFELLERGLAQGRKVLVFSQFTRMLGLLSQGLEERGIRFVSLTGSTKDRQHKVDAFQSGCADVFLISLKAGGTGLNLTRADLVIHYDPWWNPAAQSQATDRAYRMGQKNPVHVVKMVVAGSVEQRMLELQRRKQALAEGLLANADGPLSLDDVEDLFAPLDP